MLRVWIHLTTWQGVVEEDRVARGHLDFDCSFGLGTGFALSVVVQRSVGPSGARVDLLIAFCPREDGLSPLLRGVQVDKERGDAVVLHGALGRGKVVVVGVVFLTHAVSLDLQAITPAGLHQVLRLPYCIPSNSVSVPHHHSPRGPGVWLVVESLGPQLGFSLLHHLFRIFRSDKVWEQ
eukprot:CAMPEP_0196578938 /NCGR_PEP_ID=MMETSP1081-20130531/13588_1 /TAXON_ID=36882 /ORGANISM="Pyramimonas amylifera, Strain CCMP720" /LENGTH=178 /DNA_ID=CAMNT_0041898339 /DNA_START=122 /DNA_END=658 /DNA_ORIENTATION=+